MASTVMQTNSVSIVKALINMVIIKCSPANLAIYIVKHALGLSAPIVNPVTEIEYLLSVHANVPLKALIILVIITQFAVLAKL